MATSSIFAALGLVVAGIVQMVVMSRAADGRLGRNRFAGLRTKATMLSDDTWHTAHVAAKPLSMRAGQAFVASGLVLPATRVGLLLALAGIGFGIVCLYLGTRAGIRSVTEITRSKPKP